jgi:hypothetical protein
LASFLEKKDRVCEVAQLGHGGKSVVDKHYLDVLARLPKHLEPVSLPVIAGFEWPARFPPVRSIRIPRRLIAEFRAMVNRGE